MKIFAQDTPLARYKERVNLPFCRRRSKTRKREKTGFDQGDK
jgi:hypothetical protein